MPTEIEYIINKHGSFRRDSTLRQIRTSEAIAQAFSENVCRKCPAVAIIGGDYGMAGVAMLDAHEFWSVRVMNMGLNTVYELKDGVHTPYFLGPKTESILPISWKPTMPVVLGITVLRQGGYMLAGDHYLMAVDAKGNHWRLPVSNVSDVGKLCHGQTAKRFGNSLECVKFSCEMFSKSVWNSDWYNGDADLINRTKALFRFKPTEGGFEQLPALIPSGKDWTSLCQKIAVDNLNKLIQIT